MPHPLSTKPHQDAAPYGEDELTSDVDFDSTASKLSGVRPRSAYIVLAGGGSLAVETDAGNERAFHFLEAGKYVEPSPLVLRKILANTAGEDATLVMRVDNTASPSYSTFTEEFNDADATDVNIMPASEVINVDGLLIGSERPFNMLTSTLGTNGVGGTMQGSVHTGAHGAALDYSNFTAVTLAGAGKDALASGDVYWDAPSTWMPVDINNSGQVLYWFFWSVASVFSTNPVMSQGRIKHRSNAGLVVVGL